MNYAHHEVNDSIAMTDAPEAAAQIAAAIDALPQRTTATVRKVRRERSRALRTAHPEFVIELARELLASDSRNGRSGLRWVAYELIRNHKPAFQSLDDALLEELGQGMHSWDTVDDFSRTLSGPAWLHGIASDALIHRWAASEDLWWRRAALVSTVALNMRSYGGTGDTPRTLAICHMLAADREDMVQKALSWALRELVWHDPAAVQSFLETHDHHLAARVKREVRTKLTTGLKNPRRQSSVPSPSTGEG